MPSAIGVGDQPLARYVHVQTRGVRSVNLTLDRTTPASVHDYILTGQSLGTLGRIVSGVQGTTPSRAWTLTGPYGSGKSAFALFLMNLSSRVMPGHVTAMAKLRSADPVLASEVEGAFVPDHTEGFLAVAVTGQRAPFVTRCLPRPPAPARFLTVHQSALWAACLPDTSQGVSRPEVT